MVVIIAADISQILFFLIKKGFVVIVGSAIFSFVVLVAGFCSMISSWSRGVFILAVFPLSCRDFFCSSLKPLQLVVSSYETAVFFFFDSGHEKVRPETCFDSLVPRAP